MTVETAIEAALFGRVRDLWVFAANRKAWPNVKFTPPQREAYLRVEMLQNGNERLFAKGDNPHLYLGILQLTVVSPLNAGPAAATRLAGLVAGEFPADLPIYEGGLKIRIERSPDVLDPLKVDASWNVPVSIRWQSFATTVFVASLDFSDPANSQYIPLI